MHAKSVRSCSILCGSVDYSPSYSSVHGILQARILEWVAMLPSRGSSQPRDQTWISYIAGGFSIAKLPGKPGSLHMVAILIFCWKPVIFFLISCVCTQLLSCLWLSNPMDCSPPGSSVHGIFQARILEWGAISFLGDPPHPGIKPRLLHLLYWQVDSLPLQHLGSPTC